MGRGAPRAGASPPWDVVRFLHAAADAGLACRLWRPDANAFADAHLTVTRERVELKLLGWGSSIGAPF